MPDIKASFKGMSTVEANEWAKNRKAEKEKQGVTSKPEVKKGLTVVAPALLNPNDAPDSKAPFKAMSTADVAAFAKNKSQENATHRSQVSGADASAPTKAASDEPKEKPKYPMIAAIRKSLSMPIKYTVPANNKENTTLTLNRSVSPNKKDQGRGY